MLNLIAYVVILPMLNVDKKYSKKECLNCYKMKLTKLIIEYRSC